MKILDDGQVEIRNKSTGATKIVAPKDLPSYGITYDAYTKEADAYNKIKTGLVSNKDIEAKKVKDDLAGKAQGVLDVLDAGKSGKIKGQAYTDALDFASSQYAAAAGFGEGGKALTAPELTVLGGQIPTIKQQGQNIIDKMTGNIPAQKGHVVDSEDSLRRKAEIALKISRGEPVDFSQLSGSQTQEQPSLGGFLGNVGGNAKELVNGILGLPANLMAQSKQVSEDTQNIPLPLRGPAQTMGMVSPIIKGLLEDLNKTAGEPMQGGDIVGRIGQHAYEKPLDTAAWLLPFLKAGKLGKVGKGAEALKGADIVSDVTKVSKPIESASVVDKILNIPKSVGETLKSGVRKIDAGPSIYGPEKEAQIANTLDKLGIKGSAAEQYTQLKPKMSQLSDLIDTELANNPTTVSTSEIKKAFMANLNDQLRSKNLNAVSANKEIRGYLEDVYGGKLEDNISTQDLFKLKQKVNADYGKISEKSFRGQPLNDREKVISVARQTLDDIIAEKHPKVKEMTKMQSNLYDAADSLYKSRKDYPNFRIGGNSIPLPDAARSGQDFIGRLLSRPQAQ